MGGIGFPYLCCRMLTGKGCSVAQCCRESVEIMKKTDQFIPVDRAWSAAAHSPYVGAVVFERKDHARAASSNHELTALIPKT